MNDTTQALVPIVDSTPIDLAIAGWLDAHSRSAKTLKAYIDTINQYRGELRLAILSSFYEYALARYLLAPKDDQGHIANPLKIVSREKTEPYQGIHWLEPEEAEAAQDRPLYRPGQT